MIKTMTFHSICYTYIEWPGMSADLKLFFCYLTLVLLDPDIYGFKHILSQIICH